MLGIYFAVRGLYSLYYVKWYALSIVFIVTCSQAHIVIIIVTWLIIEEQHRYTLSPGAWMYAISLKTCLTLHTLCTVILLDQRSANTQFVCFFSINSYYCDVIMGAMALQITSLTIVYSTLLFIRISKKTSKLSVAGLCVGNSPVNSPHKWLVTLKMFPFDDVIMPAAWYTYGWMLHTV